MTKKSKNSGQKPSWKDGVEFLTPQEYLKRHPDQKESITTISMFPTKSPGKTQSNTTEKDDNS